jgi:hypothetical protein
LYADWDDRQELDVRFAINGHELDFTSLLEKWETELNSMVRNQAVRLIEEGYPHPKLERVRSCINTLSNALQSVASDVLDEVEFNKAYRTMLQSRIQKLKEEE